MLYRHAKRISMFTGIALLLAVGPGWSQEARPLMGGAPPVFVANRGQWGPEIHFGAWSGSTALALQDDGWVFSAHVATGSAPPGPADQGIGAILESSATTMTASVGMHFEGASSQGRLEGQAPIGGRFNFFLGEDPDRWAPAVPAFARVRYRSPYPGIDVILRAERGVFEYDLLVAPGADLADAVMRCEGIEEMSIDEDGSLVMRTPLGTLRQPRPRSWEEDSSGRRYPISCHFRRIDASRYAFEVPGRSPERRLVIDPGLVWSSYIGGYANDIAWDAAIDATGGILVAGTTVSANFLNSGQNAAGRDAFVVRIDASQTGAAQLVWATLFGGSLDEVMAVAALREDAGQLTVTGGTESTNFPATPNGYQTTYNGGTRDAFLVQLDSSGLLTYGTYLGGANHDDIQTRAHRDASGILTVSGSSDSFNFPWTPNAYQAYKVGSAGYLDVFVVRLDLSQPPANQLVYSTFIGGPWTDVGRPVVVDAAGICTVAGYTFSPNFPVTPGAYPFGGGPSGNAYDAFITRLDLNQSGSSQLIWSTFLGGSGSAAYPYGDGINGLDLGPGGHIAVAGWTDSANFPVTASAYDTTHNGGGNDAFLTWLDPALPPGQSVLYSTFLGGSGNPVLGDAATWVVLDASGAATVSGQTGSSDFPVTPGAVQTTFSGATRSAFVLRLDPRVDTGYSAPSTTALLYSTFLGGGYTVGFGFDVDPALGVVLAGQTNDPLFPTVNPVQATYLANYDGVAVHLDMLPTGAAAYGVATPSCLGPIAVGVSRMPLSPDPLFALRCTGAPPGGTGLIAFSAGPDVPGTIAGGISVHIDLALPWFYLPLTSTALGFTEVPLPLPAGLTGIQAFCQFAWVNPPGCGVMGILAASNALHLTIQ